MTLCNKKHGMSKTKFYYAWTDLNTRCSNKKYKDYYLYGGRGIKCLWGSFDAFKKDMYEPFLEHASEFGEKNTSLDRVDVNGHYCKENCRWATHKEQALNRRNNRYFLYKNKCQTISQWAEEYGMSTQILHGRVRYGWSFEEALHTPWVRRKLCIQTQRS